jgi:nitroreductase
MKTERISDHPIEPIFLKRWSPRAYDASPMPQADLNSILEAARWAPSAFNVQPWRFLYSHREDEYWPIFLSLLDAFNADWAQHASALLFVLSDTVMPGDDNQSDKLSNYHSFDTGAAWAQLALQATSLGYHAHAMAGIHTGLSRSSLVVPDRYCVEIAIAIGRRANASQLPQALQARELPSHRLSINEIAFSGAFPQ